jgi:hypothetical protein
MPILPDSFKPYVGLSAIELTDVPLTSLLPDDTQLQPTDAPVEAQLEQLLQAKTFQKVMLDALRPRVEDRSILHPSKFHPLRAQVLDKIASAAERETDPELKKELLAATALLLHLGQAHELGEQYRYALLKG